MRFTNYLLPVFFIISMFTSACSEEEVNPDGDEFDGNEVVDEFSMEGVMVEYSFREKQDDPRQNYFIQYNSKGQPLQVTNENEVLLEEFIYKEDGSEVEWERYIISPDGSGNEYDGKYVMKLTEDGLVEKLDRYIWSGEMIETREYSYDSENRITNILTADGYVDHKVVWKNNVIEKVETYFNKSLMNTLRFEYSNFKGMPKKGWGPGFFGILDGILPGPPYNNDFEYRFGMVNPLFRLGPLNFMGKVPSQIPSRTTYEDATTTNQPTTFVYTSPSNDDQDNQYDGWYIYTLRSLSSTPFYERRYEFGYY